MASKLSLWDKAKLTVQGLNPLVNSTYYTSPSSYNTKTQSSVLGNDYSSLNYNDLVESQLGAYKQALNNAQAGTRAIDLSGIIADYRRNNEANINTLNKTLNDTINALKTSNAQSRNDLLTSLKRFQESNAENMRMQQEDYNTARATLEDESFMKQRGTVANAASRGLGGSGLQQLAQLQNRIAAGKDVNTLAQKNQNVQDSLRKALTQKQEDTDTGLTNLEKNLAIAITDAQNKTAAQVNAANSETTNLINNLVYNEQVRQANARAQANNAAAALEQARLDLQNRYSSGVKDLQKFEQKVEKSLKGAANARDAKAILDKNLVKLYNDYSDLGSSYTDLARQRLNNLYNIYSRYY